MSGAVFTSRGKDPILPVRKALDLGMNVRYLVTLRPENRDSYMFHSSNPGAVASIALRSSDDRNEPVIRGFIP
jgi:diphthamide synthase (EF-2-diphthine--ammonia ligase)